MGSEMKIEIPKNLIEDTIRAEMVRQMCGENRTDLITSVVTHAMSARKDSYSSTPTFFQESVNGMIREEAMKVFREWIESNRKQISDALFKHLNENKQKRLREFAETLAGNIEVYGIHVNIDLKDKER
jgi:hypothetical protein